MHFAFPPRKTSNPSPYAARSSRSSSLRRSRLQTLALIAVAAIGGLWLLIHIFGGSRVGLGGGNVPKAVIVTVFDEKMGKGYVDAIKENRKDYALRHGYTTFFANTSDYAVGFSPRSWSILPALRHAMTIYSNTPYLFYLAPTALIMRPQLSIQEHIMNPKRLESLMIVDKPVVPPDSVIKTFSHLKGDRIDFVLSQDHDGLAHGSMVIRTGEWAKYFLDSWFDPLYRSYNFQKAEGHALEHIVQWHGTILAKLALVPQRILNSYTEGPAEGIYAEGDFIANFHGCAADAKRNCETEMQPLLTRWREMVDREGR